jgi:hypothetical protein
MEKVALKVNRKSVADAAVVVVVDAVRVRQARRTQ